MDKLRHRGARVAELLDRGTEAWITCDHGSNLRLGLQGRKAIPDAGELTETGAFGNNNYRQTQAISIAQADASSCSRRTS